MTEARRLLFVLSCLCCLLIVASALPAADPRLEGPGASEGGTSAGDWDAVTPSSDPAAAATGDDDGDGDTSNADHDRPDASRIEIDGAIEPGSNVTVKIDDTGHFNKKTIAVNGERAGETNPFGRIDVVVPYTDEMTVSVRDENRSKTVDVSTTATIEAASGAAPDRDLEVAAAVGSTPIADATVSLDGEAVATTDEDGVATVALPETAGPAELRVERGAVEGERTIDVAEPTVEFASDPLILPGFPAAVQVSADGIGVPNATVALEGGGEVTTDGDGRARLWMPVDDEATVTADVGAETASVTVGNLYLRLTALVVLGPGFFIGAVVTYLRLVATRKRRRGRVTVGLFVALANALAGLWDALARPFDSFGWPRAPSPSLPSISIPRPNVGGGIRSFGTALSSFGGAIGTLPSLGSILDSSNRSAGTRGSLFRGRFGSEDGGTDDSSGSGNEGPRLAAEPLAPRGPRAEIHAAWHAFLDRLGVENRATRTPGQLARRAIAAGFPAASVRRLVALFRDIEYGTHEPSPERVAEVRAAVAELLDHERDEEGSE